jgi:hypothetical protein
MQHSEGWLRVDRQERLFRSFGWMSISMGLAFAAPAQIGRLLGIRDQHLFMRAIGMRDFVIGMGLLRGRHRVLWLRLQALADLVDAAFVGRVLCTRTATRRSLLWLIFALGSGAFSWYQAQRLVVAANVDREAASES